MAARLTIHPVVNRRPLGVPAVVPDPYTETFTLTFGDCGENHVRMQKIGQLASVGYSLADLQTMATWFNEHGATTTLRALHEEAGIAAEPAYLLVVKGGVNRVSNADALLEEQRRLQYDRQALMYGQVRNKHARWNVCFSEQAQEPNIAAGRGRIVAFETVPVLNAARETLASISPANEGLIVEGNYYYDVKACGIGYHGDSERRKVIGMRLGATIPLVYQWFQRSKPVGPRMEVTLRHGDLYVMSEKAVGTDWKSSSKLTLRHAAGAAKYLTPSK